MYSLSFSSSQPQGQDQAPLWTCTLSEMVGSNPTFLKEFHGSSKHDVQTQAELFSAEESTGLRLSDGHSAAYILAVAKGHIKL